MEQTITIKNPTKCYVPFRTKSLLSIPRSTTYSARLSRELSYQVRLYYEFLHCKNVSHGKTFYYTLTYNDKHIPRINGRVVFDYADIRTFLNGAFYKFIRSKYDCSLKYCVFGERGDGKGFRGFGNNPHYHVILFLRPNKEGTSFDIPTDEFTEYVRYYWQGDKRHFNDPGVNPRDFKFGIVEEGSEGAEVIDYRAFSYCCKYCSKSVSDIRTDSFLERQLKIQVTDEFLSDQENINRYYSHLHPSEDVPFFLKYSDLHCSKFDFLDYFREDYNAVLSKYIASFRNRHTSRVRISNGIGVYALDHVFEDGDSLKVLIPDKNGYKAVSSGLYLFRKKYMEVRKCPDSGQPYYAYTDAGLNFREKSLCIRIHKMFKKTSDVLMSFLNDEKLYNRFYDHYHLDGFDGVSIPTFWHFYHQFPAIDVHRLDDIVFDYSVYKLVYENRKFFTKDWTDIGSISSLDVLSDYRTFLSDPRTEFSCTDFNRFCSYVDGYGYMYPYCCHPTFSKNVERFALLDYLSDFIDFLKDQESEKEANERRLTRLFHKNLKYVDYSEKN